MLDFIIGLFIGGMLGFFITALLVASKRGDREDDNK